VELLRRRFLEWLSAVESVEEYSESLRLRLGRASVVLHRSFARGDFNAWSDVDLTVVSEKFRGVRILGRYNLLGPPPPRAEVVPLTPEEFEANLEKPAWRYALSRGSAIAVDRCGVSKAMARRGAGFAAAERLKSGLASAMSWSSLRLPRSAAFIYPLREIS